MADDHYIKGYRIFRLRSTKSTIKFCPTKQSAQTFRKKTRENEFNVKIKKFGQTFFSRLIIK